ncbi:MAG: 3-deoxy-D-manno-octulosonic-acid transferase [Glaciecola sp.]|jgi:3-deoxy-D-manno-octulosonic-acid transferase
MNFTMRMRIIYNWAIRTYGALLFVAQIFSKKAQLWVAGRKDWREKLKIKLDSNLNGKPVIWVHVSSHGEFEQGKTVIDGLRDNHPNHHILLTFFSPSGYELLKDYSKAHTVSYLPLDTQKQARDFIKIVQPTIALFVKYEFWYNHLNACFKSNVPVVFFSSSFRENQVFFRNYGKWFLNHLKQCEHFFVRDGLSDNLLKSNGITQCSVVGDTRFDAVNRNANVSKKFPEIGQFIAAKKTLVFGSIWPEDEQVLLPWLNGLTEDIKIIIAPHEIDLAKINNLCDKIKLSTALHSGGNYANSQVLILDCVGVLKHLYQYSSINYIGGGFGTGIHNLLEPTSYGSPVVFGPNNHKFMEAKELQEIGAGYEVNDAASFKKTMNKLLVNDKWDSTKLNAYFSQNIGASVKVLKYVEAILQRN